MTLYWCTKSRHLNWGTIVTKNGTTICNSRRISTKILNIILMRKNKRLKESKGCQLLLDKIKNLVNNLLRQKVSRYTRIDK